MKQTCKSDWPAACPVTLLLFALDVNAQAGDLGSVGKTAGTAFNFYKNMSQHATTLKIENGKNGFGS